MHCTSRATCNSGQDDNENCLYVCYGTAIFTQKCGSHEIYLKNFHSWDCQRFHENFEPWKFGAIRYVRYRAYCIAGNFRGRKLSRISRFFRHLWKFSPRNSRHATPIMRPVLTFRQSFLSKMLLSYWSAKVFSLKNFPLYGSSLSYHHRGGWW